MSGDEMTRQERTNLSRIARLQAKAAKSSVAHRKSQLLADYEDQSAAMYASQDAAWADVVAEGRRAIEVANERIRQVCEERNIPAELAPSIGTYWSPRGVSDPKRRTELRKLAERQIDAAARQAVAAIDKAEAAVQIELLAATLTTEAAHAFLKSIPTPEELMPPLRLDELEQSVPRDGGRRALR